MKTPFLKRLNIVLLFLTISATALIAQRFTIQSRGTNRTYLVRLPQNYSAGNSVPLLIFLHGGGFTADLADTTYGFTAHGYSTGYIVVYPQGLNESWSAAADVPFISALIDTLCNKYTINKQKIYAAGHSAGGYMVNILACQLSGKIAAFGDIAGFMEKSSSAYYKPVKPVPILKIHGTNDPEISYYGNPGNFVSADSVIGFWKHNNKALTLRDSLAIPDTCKTDNSTVVRYRYGEGSSEVVFYKVINGGHDSPNWIWQNAMGKTNRDISAPEVLWDFFKEHTLVNLTVNYIANDGFLIEGQDKRILIDALFNEGMGSYTQPSAFTANRIIKNLEPFKNIDACLVTHSHGDHLSATMVNDFMKNSTKTRFCGPQDATTALAGQEGYESYKSRIFETTPDYYQSIDTTLNGIKFKILRLHHLGDNTVNIGYLFELNGIKIFHSGDSGTENIADMDAFNLDKENIDIAFIHYGFYAFYETTRNTLKRIGAKHYILMHIDIEYEKAVADSVAKYSKSIPATMFMRSGDIKTFNKLADTFYIENTNICPQIKTPIPDTSVQMGKSFNFKIPAGCIIETNPFDKIEYNATLNDGKVLPGWLKFNASSQAFTGTPDKIENLIIRISATDSYFANVYDEFKISVKSISAIEKKTDKGLIIFPNPTTGQIYFSFDTAPLHKALISIFNTEGKQVISKTLFNSTCTNIDLSGYSKGIYFVKTLVNSNINYQKICLE
jgi:polyhydroxybutyrate depolymerase